MTLVARALAALFVVSIAGDPRPAPAQSVLSPDFADTNAGYTASERAGRQIWMFATAFNDRFLI